MHVPTPAAEGDDEPAPTSGDSLERLLERWRTSRTIDAARELDLLDVAEQKRLKQQSRGKLDTLWRANAANPRATGWLAANIFTDPRLASAPMYAFELDEGHEGFAEYDGPGSARNPGYVAERFAVIFERFEALKKLLPDPRAGAQLLKWVVKPSLGPINETEVFEQLMAAVAQAADTRQISALKSALAHQPWKRESDRVFFTQQIPPVIDALSAGGAPSPDSKPSATRSNTDEMRALDELMLALLSAPRDDAPRLVLADWLLERRDPRGEVIMIQVRAARNKASPAEVKRAASLTRKYAAQWLGPVARVLGQHRWSRGFLASARVEQNSSAPLETWQAAFTHPSLELLETLSLGNGNRRNYISFLLGGRLLSLDSSCIPPDLMPALQRAAGSRSA